MKKIIRQFTLVLTISLGFAVSSCTDDSSNPTTSGSNGSMTCKINGSSWTGKGSTFNNSLNIDMTSGNHLIIDGKDENDTRIVLTANGDKPGTYVLDVPNSKFDAGASLQIMDNGQRVIATTTDVTITITSLDQSSQKASGSFRFVSDDNKYDVTSGTFKDLHFEIK